MMRIEKFAQSPDPPLVCLVAEIQVNFCAEWTQRDPIQNILHDHFRLLGRNCALPRTLQCGFPPALRDGRTLLDCPALLDCPTLLDCKDYPRFSLSRNRNLRERRTWTQKPPRWCANSRTAR